MKYYVPKWKKWISKEEAEEINQKQIKLLEDLKPGDDTTQLTDVVFMFPENLQTEGTC